MPLYKNGIYIGFNSRLIGDVTKSLRYRFFVNKLEISNFIYNFHKVNTVIIVEGIFDLMWLYENGIKNVISFMSASASNGQLLALQPFKNLIFMYDNDNGGKSGVIKNSKFILGNMPDKFIYNANLPDKKDVNESSREELYNSLKKLNRIKNVPV
jgi:DNA primase